MYKAYYICILGLLSCAFSFGKKPKRLKQCQQKTVATPKSKKKQKKATAPTTSTLPNAEGVKPLEAESPVTLDDVTKALAQVTTPKPEDSSQKTVAATSTTATEHTKAKTSAELTVPKAEGVKPLERTIPAPTVTVTNDITKKMITYTHLFVPYTPTTFTLTVNGKTLEQGDHAAIAVPDNTIEVVYYADFLNGYRKNSQSFTFALKPGTKKVSITFNWHKDPNVLINNATLLAKKSIIK